MDDDESQGHNWGEETPTFR